MTAQAPAMVLDDVQIEGLELLLSGLLVPADGYLLPGESREAWSLTPVLWVDGPLAQSIADGGTIHLCDRDTTPLAELSIDRTQPGDGGVWVAGRLTSLRRPEHGLARGMRLAGDDALEGSVVALFSGEVRAADMLALAGEARPVMLVAAGSTDAAESLTLIRELEDCARRLPDARVVFIPLTNLAPEADVPLLVVRTVGATDIRDFRRGVKSAGARSGAVLLLSGLSGAGKSTIARALADDLRAGGAGGVVLLDGDHVRTALASELGFSAEDRDRNLQRQAWVAARVAEAGGLAICAPIAPFAASRAAMRAKVEPESVFLLVHVSTPLAVAEQRDRKGLYAKARAGLISDFTGIDSPYEIPEDADLELDTSVLSVDACVVRIRALLAEKGLMR